MSYNYLQKEKEEEEEIVNKNIDHHHHHLTNNNRLVISKSDGELNHHQHQFYKDDSSTLLLNNNNNNNEDDDDDEIEVDSNIDVLKSNRVLLAAAAAAAATSTANQEKQDHHNHHHHSTTNNKNFLQTSQSSFSFPGDIHQHNHPYQDFNSTSSFNNLSDAFQSLFIPQFAQQIQTTIMSGLNWIHQIQATTLFQNFWTSGFLRRRFSQQNQSPTTTINNDSMVQSSSSNVDNNSSSYNHHSQYKFAKILNGTIKLHTLKPSELIELSSFGLVELDQDVEPGIGHEFQRYENDRSTWCDSCGEFLFPSVMNDNNIDIGDLNGHDHKQPNKNDPKPDNQLNNENDNQNSTKTSTITATTAAAATPASVQADHLIRTYFQCIKCKYVCHWKCLNLIRIDCRQQQLQQNYPTKATTATRTTTKMSNNTITPLVATALITSTLPLSTEFNTNNNNNSSSSSSNSNSSNDVSSIKTEIDSNNNHNNDDDEEDDEHRNKEQQRFDDIEARSVSYENSQHNTLSELTTPFSSTVAASSTTTTMAISDEDDATINGSMDKVFNDDEENNNHNNNNNDENQIKKKQQQQEENNNNKSAQQSYLITPRLILDLRAKILKYNERVRGKGSGLGITLIDENNGLFRGFLRVHMNLTRPINVIAGKRPPSIYDIINEDENNVQQQRRTLTSFYMPRDTVKNIHITSDSTSLQVIKAMLKKFKVVDNPQKFALYLRRRFPDEELTMVKTADGQQSTNNNNNDQNNSTTRISDDHQNEMTLSKFLRTAGHDHSLKRLHDHEKPLILQLEFDSFAYGSVDIVMQENDNADIAWDAFEIPELRNFLKILEREEGEHLEHVKIHYREMRKLLQALIDYENNKITSGNNKNRARQQQQPQHDNGNHDRSSSSIPVVIH